MITKLDKIVAFDKRPLAIKSNETFIKWSREVKSCTLTRFRTSKFVEVVA